MDGIEGIEEKRVELKLDVQNDVIEKTGCESKKILFFCNILNTNNIIQTSTPKYSISRKMSVNLGQFLSPVVIFRCVGVRIPTTTILIYYRQGPSVETII